MIRTLTAAALALALTSSLAYGEEEGKNDSSMMPGTASSATAQPGSAASTTAQPGSPASSSSSSSWSGTASATSPSGMSGSAQFTDAKTFVRQKWQDQKVLDDIYKLADDKAENKAVKDLAEKAAKDHKQAQDKLKDLASELKVDKDTAAAPAGQPSSQITSIKNRLNTLSGKEFDKTFLSEIINVHQVDIALFQAASTRATEESVKKFAQECVPKLQQHLQSAKDAYQQVTGTAWTPGLGSYTPTATYSTQPGATGTGTSPMGTSPGTSTSPSGASSSSAPGSTSGASHSGTAQPDTDQ